MKDNVFKIFNENLACLPQETYDFLSFLLMECKAFLVGSILTDQDFGDIDVFVSPNHWPKASRSIPETATPNKLGGWRFSVGGIDFDVWPDTPERIMTEDKCNLALSLCTGTLLRREDASIDI